MDLKVATLTIKDLLEAKPWIVQDVENNFLERKIVNEITLSGCIVSIDEFRDVKCEDRIVTYVLDDSSARICCVLVEKKIKDDGKEKSVEETPNYDLESLCFLMLKTMKDKAAEYKTFKLGNYVYIYGKLMSVNGKNVVAIKSAEKISQMKNRRSYFEELKLYYIHTFKPPTL